MGNFPASLPTERNTSGSETLNAAGGLGVSGLLNELSEEVLAVATKIGTGSSTPGNGKVLKSDSSGTSLWAAVDLTGDVTGVLPVANGGTGQTSLTNLTLVTPTIASLTNAQHDHTSAAEGGSLGSNTVDVAQLVDNAVTTAKITDGTVTAAKLDTNGIGHGFIEIKRTTLESAGDTITVSSIPAYKYLIFLFYGNATGGTLDTTVRFNNDSGTNYMSTHSVAFGAAVVNGNTAQFAVESGSTDSGGINTGKMEVIANITAEEKNVKYEFISQDAAGATIPTFLEGFGKWMNTSAQINRIDWINGGTGDFAIGSEVLVLGKN